MLNKKANKYTLGEKMANLKDWLFQGCLDREARDKLADSYPEEKLERSMTEDEYMEQEEQDERSERERQESSEGYPKP